MNPIGIILMFGFLVLLTVLGIVLTGVGTIRLRHQARNSPSIRAAIVAFSWQSVLVALGLLCLAYGIIGGYRLIWGT